MILFIKLALVFLGLLIVLFAATALFAVLVKMIVYLLPFIIAALILAAITYPHLKPRRTR